MSILTDCFWQKKKMVCQFVNAYYRIHYSKAAAAHQHMNYAFSWL